jgi:hypothetical protein
MSVESEGTAPPHPDPFPRQAGGEGRTVVAPVSGLVEVVFWEGSAINGIGSPPTNP